MTLEGVRTLIANPARKTRTIKIADLRIGGEQRIAVQTMCSTKTQDIAATLKQVSIMQSAGADLIRIAVDSRKDAEAVEEIRNNCSSRLVVDLQENYRLASVVAPHVDKIRYNPGHLYHHERTKPWQDKVKFIVDCALENGIAIRIGVNCGSVDPSKKELYPASDSISPMVDSAMEHAALLEELNFKHFCVSLKDSNPNLVVEANQRFSEQCPTIPLHLGVTEAGLPPEGIIKTRIAFEQLISKGIGDTLRVSLTVPSDQKGQEIQVGQEIIDDIANGRFRSVVRFDDSKLNIVSCPSCSRVENEAFVELAQQVKEMSRYAQDHSLTIAVMGCRVNGPGETDDADLGLWCAPSFVNLKKRGEELGAFPYSEILGKLKAELDALIQEQSQ